MSEDIRLPNGEDSGIEVPPSQGLTLRIADPPKVGDFIRILKQEPNTLRIVEQLYRVDSINPDGSVGLGAVVDDLGAPKEEREAIAKEITSKIILSLRDEIGPLVEAALTRKPKGKLQKLLGAARNNEGARLKTEKRDCVTLMIGEEETIL